MFCSALTAECEYGEIGNGTEQFYAAFGEQFGGRYREYRRQFEHGVYACPNSVFGACIFVEYGKFAALGETAAHDAHDGIASAFRACLFQKIGVPVVKGIVFANYAANSHFPFQNLYFFLQIIYNNIWCRQGAVQI